MRKEVFETGKTVDAAIDAACEALGCSRDECEWEIIDLPKKTFLGLKFIPAKVRVSIEVPDPEPVKAKPQPQPEKPPAPVAVEKPKDKPAPPPPPKTPKEQPKREAKQPEVPPAQAPPAKKPERRFREEELEEFERIAVLENFTPKETAVVGYLEGILREFSIKAQVNLFREGSGICIEITGEGLGTIIGHRGETLDAIQYLTGLVANRLEGEYMRVTVDCGGYRMKRKETLEALAKKLADQVLKTNVSKTLEPMNPFERRVIHATVSKIEGVSSASVGEEPNRRVVITSPTARRASPRSSYGRDRDEERRPRSGGRDRGGRGDDRRRSRGPRQQTPPPPSGPPKETPEASAIGDAPMGKLDLE